MTERKMHLEDWLDDLCVRFILNLPLADLGSIERICFQVEEAQWFYEDFVRPLDPALPSMSLRRFCERIFAHCPLLSDFSQGEHMQAFEQFMEYKARVPVRGAIMLNQDMDSAVLVKGWKKGANWSFPRGKINKDEDDLDCAIREVYEETGYNLEEAGLVPLDRKVKRIEVNMRDQQMQLFVFRNVPMDTYFEPRTRKEISKINWWRLSDLPAFRKKGQEQPQAATSANKFYMVAPFLVPLRKWVVEEKKKDAKRASSGQYLSTGQDEPFTEDDRGAESADPGPFNHGMPHGMLDHDSLEDASAALNRLLKVQQPQELQADHTSTPPQPNKTGEALLAILHSQPPTSNQPLPHNVPPHTPQDHTLVQPQMPSTPHHFPPRPPQFSSMAPPPMFPIQPQPQAFSYQQPITHNQYRHPGFHQNTTMHAQQPPPKRNENPHSHQSQHLVHPQPLPPHVQRAVFTGGAVHAPMVPPPQYISPPQLNSSVSVTASTPQFPGLHSTMVPPEPKLSPPKLTSHSLALLNAFKSRDQADGEIIAAHGIPLQNYAQEPSQPHRVQPQELSADASLQAPEPPHQQADHLNNGSLGISSPTLAARPAISETQRSTLLGLFKSPAAQAAVPVHPLAATTLPSTTPSAVELSAVEPLSTNAVPASVLSNAQGAPDHTTNNSAKLRLPSGAQVPFRPAGILARPAELSDKEVSVKNGAGQKLRSNGKKPSAPARSQIPAVIHSEKPFQPQILKRPQPGLSKSPEDFTPTQSKFPALSQPLLEQSTTMPVDHSQTLLSLFRKTAPAAATSFPQHPVGETLISLPPIDPALGIAARSRVGSLASAEGGPRRGSQTPISPADKGFLLNYLDAVANGVQR